MASSPSLGEESVHNSDEDPPTEPEAEEPPPEEAAVEEDPPPRGAGVEARGLSLRGPRGWVYRDVTFEVPPGEVAALVGDAGSGRTSLLLTLGGRMRPTGGTAVVGGHRLPGELRAVQRIAALGLVAGVTEPDPALTVAEHVSEAIDLREGLFGRLRGRRRRIAAALDRVGLEVDPRMRAHDLLPDEAQLLGVALALIGDPGLVLLDDLDDGLPVDAQQALWRRLREIADTGITIVAACHDATAAQGLAEIVRIEHPRTMEGART
ncbi:ATP-binding cassette domain-containing protein [Thermomonospora amylolytica]|uniref:ATP-binding cassette domain-containing protein n=1 Tax=Thermomonospora amylolytica TaxID=1411117 RepID=UPI001F460199|nr:ATP-binding cassette domain-containing protein [Thermomonospora amylolytica]